MAGARSMALLRQWRGVMAPLSPCGGAALEVRQAMVLTFQNLRYLFDSCLPILDKGFRLLDKDFLAVLTTNRSALSECALVCPALAGRVWLASPTGFVCRHLRSLGAAFLHVLPPMPLRLSAAC